MYILEKKHYVSGFGGGLYSRIFESGNIKDIETKYEEHILKGTPKDDLRIVKIIPVDIKLVVRSVTDKLA